MKQLYIIDASGYLYRSYFAIKNMSNIKGESTNALYGFIRSLQKLRKDFQPTWLVAVFDGPRSSSQRATIYPEYKAHRRETPSDLIDQIKWAQEACAMMGIPLLSLPGVEADDTMGSIAFWAKQQDFHSYLCTSDKDLCQLVSENISILNTFKDNQIWGPKEVEDNFGVPPSKMVDFLAIVGDASDNVPGIPGFGPKTAAEILQKHGSLDYILSHPEVIVGKKGEVLQQSTPQALISRQLVTLDTAIPIPQEISFYTLQPIQMNELKSFYSSMNFHTLMRELDEFTPLKEKTIDESLEYRFVDDEATAQETLLMLSQQKKIGMAILGTENQPMKSDLVGMAFCVNQGKAFYFPANGKLGLSRLLHLLKPFLENKQHAFFGHNMKLAYLLLKKYQIDLASISSDTMVLSYLLNSHLRQHTLDSLMIEHFGKVKKQWAVLLGKGKQAKKIEEIPPEEIAFYLAEEADYSYRLEERLSKQLQERHLTNIFQEIEMPLLFVLAEMENHGIYLDPKFLKTMSTEIFYVSGHLQKEICELAGEEFNVNSSKQLSEILFNKMGIVPPKKTATGLSTSAEVLESLQEKYAIAGKILEYRTLEKLRSTYLDALPMEIHPKTGRIHCTFNQTVAATGRLSCQEPNLQNIPIRSEIGKKIREAFRPEKEGWSYLAADYSQIELRILAHLSEDPHLIEAFRKGEDIHRHTASLIFHIPQQEVSSQQRYQAKAVNFGIVYGQQAYGLSQELGISTKEAARFIEEYFKQYQRVKTFTDSCIEQTRKFGKATTYMGRERLIPEINSKNGMIRSAAERLAINTPLQGTAADLIKMAMIAIDKKLREQDKKGYMILQIHDELVFELPNEEIESLKNLVKQTMENVFTLKVPLVVDLAVGKNWAEC